MGRRQGIVAQAPGLALFHLHLFCFDAFFSGQHLFAAPQLRLVKMMSDIDVDDNRRTSVSKQACSTCSVLEVVSAVLTALCQDRSQADVRVLWGRPEIAINDTWI